VRSAASDASDRLRPISGEGDLFAASFATDEMRRVFDDLALVQSWLDAEAALAEAEARLGVIPAPAAERIRASARAELLDLAAIRDGMAGAGHPLVPTIWALADLCGPEAGGYVHWGATTQDIMDTGLVLQLRTALDLLGTRLDELCNVVADLATRERDTVMAGRTHGQQALPITFGLKAATWLDELRRHCQRLEQLRPRLLVGQLAGAAGTLASLGERAADVQVEFCRILDLDLPLVPWHVSRDGLAELASTLAIIAATAEKLAGEIILLQKTEVAASRLVRRTLMTAVEGMVGQHERDMGSWQAEWRWVPEICTLADAVLKQSVDLVGGLTLDRDRMLANLEATNGLIMAERVMIELGRHIGRQAAHDRIHEHAMRAVETRTRLVDLLAADEVVVGALGGEEALCALLSTQGYLGAAALFVDRTVSAFRSARDGRA
jgi:3-carboxy-cis,cis-muconate cycloisomerase